jgi:hypothetical protein
MSEERQQEPCGWFSRRFDARFKVRLAGTAVGVLLALLIAPATRRLVLAQIGLTLPVPATVASVAGSELGTHPNPFEPDIAFHNAHSLAAQRPDDLQLQIANAVLLHEGDTSKQKIERLRTLESRFADRPSLYANILRYEAMGWVKSHHETEQAEMSEYGAGHTQPGKPQPIDVAEYAAYDRDAAAGERLNPNNAYFPFMRAIGLFGNSRDAEALAEIDHAASCPQWNEYYDDELKGTWRIQDDTSVNNSALFHTMSAAALLFPQYAQMRGAARVTIHAAMRAEQAGRYDEGLALRKSMLRIGSLMRTQSGSLIGALVGISITELATARPAGAPFIRIASTADKAGREKRRQQFDAYLKHIDRAGEIDAFHTAQQAGDEIKSLIKPGVEYGPFNQVCSLLIWWIVDLLTLANIFWLCVLGGLGALFLRNRRAQSGLALPPSVRFLAPVGFIGGALAAPYFLTWLSPYLHGMEANTAFCMLMSGLAPIPVVVLAALLLPAKTGRQRRHWLGIYGGGLLAGFLFAGLVLWQSRGFAGISILTQVFNNLSDEGGQGGVSINWALPLCAAGMPILLGLAVSIISLVCRVPLSVGLARGYRGLMAPAAAVLFLAYGGMMLYTVRLEAQVQYGLNRTLENEVSYTADLSGKPMPHADVAKRMGGR